jgi:hypothetical protein
MTAIQTRLLPPMVNIITKENIFIGFNPNRLDVLVLCEFGK